MGKGKCELYSSPSSEYSIKIIVIISDAVIRTFIVLSEEPQKKNFFARKNNPILGSEDRINYTLL